MQDSTIIEISSDDDAGDDGENTRNNDDCGHESRQKRRLSPVKTTAPAKRGRRNNNSSTNRNTELDYNEHNAGQGQFGWTVVDLLAERTSINASNARNIVNLLENENTIPFICRYRRDLINHLEPERLREIKNSYNEILNLRKKIDSTISQLTKENAINEQQRIDILNAKTNDELEFLSAPFKPANKGSLADRAKALGLEIYADRLLHGDKPMVVLQNLIDKANDALDTEEKVLSGIVSIVSHNIAKSSAVLEHLRQLRSSHRIMLQTKRTKNSMPSKVSNCGTKQRDRNDVGKYEHYFNFQSDVRYLKPHQILAINRAEDLKFITVKLILPDSFKTDMQNHIYEVFMTTGLKYDLRSQVFQRSFEDCFSRKLRPLLNRQIRSNLNERAKKASIDVFAKNLKQLLLISPVKGERILGIDPGFTNGCKYAVISETADVLETGVFYPHKRDIDPQECGEQLCKVLAKHNCKLIALGNGTACRETELWITKLFDMGLLDRKVIRYCIVSEQGASIYSCSPLASREFPNIDINEIGAVSIARRLNDPLSEYVKIEPRHIGVGMYQHDVNEKSLSNTLNEVVSECVSYVGVDVNTASLSVLKHVAGLTENKADKIVEYRTKNGPFLARKDLLNVPFIGTKTYQQCAGFVRIEPRSVGGCVSNPLDSTWVHPESYDVATKIINKCKLQIKDIGSPSFRSAIALFEKDHSLDELSAELGTPKERLEIVLLALQRELNQDYRDNFDQQPLFKQGVISLNKLKVGDVVTGAVTNVTHFGAFVDIGVETAALIHISRMHGEILLIGRRVTATIAELDIARKRINLNLI